MSTTRFHFSPKTWALLVLGAAMACSSAQAANKTSAAELAARYQQERATCLNGDSNQDRATCLREAGAAHAQAKRGDLDDGPAAYARNARQRCEALPDTDRRDCLARMQGQGTTRGSVASGGIYRELVTIETREPAPPTTSREPADAPK